MKPLLYESFKRTLSTLFKEPVKVIVAFSGGSDSVALLHLFWRVRKEFPWEIKAVHIEHGIRGASSQKDADFAVCWAKKWGIPLEVEHINVPEYVKKNQGISTEEAARKLRYEVLKKKAQIYGSSVIALGHHADDQVETILLNILRGSGLAGLRGINLLREEAGFSYLRPLLGFTKQEILDYCTYHQLQFVDDETNFQTDYTRNRVRLELLPLLQSYNPQVKEALLRLGEAAEETEKYLDDELNNAKIPLLKGPGWLGVELNQINHLHPLLKKRLYRQMVQKLTGYFPDYKALMALESLTKEMKGTNYYCLGSGLVASREYHRLFLAYDWETLPEPKTLLAIAKEGQLVDPGWKVEINSLTKEKINLGLSTPYSEIIDEDKIKSPLRLRKRKNGDLFYPLGAKGEKKLKDFFIDLKVPKRIRDRIPLLVDAEDRIIWVVGFRISELVKVDENTNRCLQLRIVQSCQAGSPVL